METDKLIEWIEFQFSFTMTDVAKISVKNKLQSYAKEHAIEFLNWCSDVHNDEYKWAESLRKENAKLYNKWIKTE